MRRKQCRDHPVALLGSLWMYQVYSQKSTSAFSLYTQVTALDNITPIAAKLRENSQHTPLPVCICCQSERLSEVTFWKTFDQTALLRWGFLATHPELNITVHCMICEAAGRERRLTPGEGDDVRRTLSERRAKRRAKYCLAFIFLFI